MLDNVTKGKQVRPYLMLIYGPDGVGKSTFAADAPSPIFIGKEDGTHHLHVARFPEPKSYGDIITCLDELRTDTHEFKTVALDSLDWFEPLVWAAVCREDRVNSIEKVGGGYGKGYLEANSYWMKMIDRIRMLREARGMNVIAIAHSQIKAFNDPTHTAPYDRYQVKINEKAAAIWREFVDVVGFATYEVYTQTDASGKKSKAFGDGKRVLYTERRPGFDAKNRLGLPFELALSFPEFVAKATKGEPESASVLLASINELTGLVPEETRVTVVEATARAGTNVQTLSKILNRLRVITTK